MAVYPLAFPDGTPYPTIPAGTNVVNVSTSGQLTTALSNAVAGQRIVLADGTYSGAFSMSGRTGTATAGISVEAANVGGAQIASGSSFRITNCTYVTVKGLMWNWQGSGETFQFRGTSHHCRLTRCTFGPTSHTSSTAVQTWVFVGDDCYHIRIDHNEIRNKGTSGNGVRVYGSFAKVDAGQGSSAGCRWVRIDHNIFRAIKPEVGNDKEPVRYGVSTMSRTIANGVIERNVFHDCVCEPEVISVKMGGIRTTGNSILQCIGGPVIRHGTNSIMSDNYIVDRASTFGSTIGSGGIRFYDADHTVSYNHIDGVRGGNYQGPLMLDTGDAEGSSTNLSAHWRVIGAMVERNVIVDSLEGVRIGDNYNSVPRDCTIRHNIVVNAPTGAAITQLVAPSNTVMEPGNLYFATLVKAGMTTGADTIARKPGYGPRVTYLALTDVGPAADLSDTDGTGVEVTGGGGGDPVAVPADVLNIGSAAGQNHFQLQYAVDGSTGNNWSKAEFEQLTSGFSADPYFKVVTNTIDGVAVPAVQFRVRADAATTSGSSFPRSELRETRSTGAEMAFDAMTGFHSLRTKARVDADFGRFPRERVNPNGGSVALGHPFGALLRGVRDAAGPGDRDPGVLAGGRRPPRAGRLPVGGLRDRHRRVRRGLPVRRHRRGRHGRERAGGDQGHDGDRQDHAGGDDDRRGDEGRRLGPDLERMRAEVHALDRVERAECRSEPLRLLSEQMPRFLRLLHAMKTQHAADVSLVRVSSVHVGANSVSGSRKAAAVSAAKARSGVIHRTCSGAAATSIPALASGCSSSTSAARTTSTGATTARRTSSSCSRTTWASPTSAATARRSRRRAWTRSRPAGCVIRTSTSRPSARRRGRRSAPAAAGLDQPRGQPLRR